MIRLLALTAFLSTAIPAQVVGSPLPPAHLHGLTGTTAGSLAELVLGRAVLFEFFSYW